MPDSSASAQIRVPERSVAEINAPAPSASVSFEGLDYNTWGSGHPADTTGDVGPNHYIESINSAVGIYSKSGTRLAAFTLDALMSQGSFGNLCDTDNYGDPVVLYDTFEDRWVITDFAFQLLSDGSVANPPGAFQCFAVSKTGDPVSGGWNFYYAQLIDALNDYPKLGVWTDGIYMSANLFGFSAVSPYVGPRVWAFNKAQMYAGSPTVQIVSFDAPTDDFTLLPSNARLQTGTPPPGRPNYLTSTWSYLNALTVYKFHVDWDRPTLSTFTGPDVPSASSSWPDSDPGYAPALGGNTLDTLGLRAMAQSQYSRIGGVESLWLSQTVRRGDTNGFAAPRWYQVNVTGGTVAANLPQAATWDPDSANVMHRFMPSVAVNRNGDLAIGYSTSSSSTKPAIKYAGRLAGDALNAFSQTETTLIQGAGAQYTPTGSLHRWGDYSAMTLDPDGCRFWYANMYYAADGVNHKTRIGAFSFPGCAAIGNGTFTGTVTNAAGGAPLAGATVSLGSRTATTNASGVFTFTLPAGTYPQATVSLSGFGSSTTTSVVVPSGGTVTWDVALAAAPASACLTDTTQSDFQTGLPTNCSLSYSVGNVAVANATTIDQQNSAVTNNGFEFNSSAWVAQTFRPSASGAITRVDLDLFCSGCSGSTPDITVSIRATNGNPATPSGGDLGTATIAGFSSGVGGLFPASFSSPVAVTAGATYAIVVRASSNPSAGTYAYVCSCTPDSDPYASGARVTSPNSGSSWQVVSTDLGFKVYMSAGFGSSGTFVSSTKDANPAFGNAVSWGTISWTASTPGTTGVTFQVAASVNPLGPFTFVGPDGTSATSFTNGASLARFNGKRYLKYRATLTTSNSATTPLLQEVTVCFSNAIPQLSINDVSVIEGNAGTRNASFAVSLSAASAQTITVSAVTSNGTATAPGDYTATGPTTITFAPGDSTKTFTVPVIGEALAEANETFTVTLSNPINAVIADGTGVGTIADDDACLVGGGVDSDFDGIPNTVEPGEGTNPCARDNDIFTSGRLFAMQQYRDFLGREGDAGGITHWTSVIAAGTLRAAVTKAFFDSPEFQGAVAPVTRLYFAYFNRIPDRVGLEYWVAMHRAGLSPTAISQSFATAPEFVATYGSLSNSAFVTLVYNNVLGRAPDANGLATWTGQLDSGAMTRGEVMLGFSESPEYRQRSYNRVFVTMTYYGMLRRMPEPAGFAFWVGSLEAGVSSQDLINGFLVAPEYRGRFLP